MIADARKYPIDRLTKLGLTEWCDGFNTDNIPDAKTDNAFHVRSGTARTISTSQDSYEMDVPCTVKIFRSPQMDVKSLIEDSEVMADDVVKDLIAIRNRLNWPGIKNFTVNTVDIDPLRDSNDNGVVIKIECTARITIACR